MPTIRNFDNQATCTAATTVCRDCGGRLALAWQPSYSPNRAGYWLATCWDPHCRCYGFTVSDNIHAEGLPAHYRTMKGNAS
jgi:hypothetical protein